MNGLKQSTKPRTHSVPKAQLIYLVTSNPFTGQVVERSIHRKAQYNIVVVSNLGALKSNNSCAKVGGIIVDKDGALSANKLKWMRTYFSLAPLLFLGEYSFAEMAALVWAGASGFISYKKMNKEILCALEAVSKGGLWVRHEVLEYCVLKVQQTKKKRGALSFRQNQILQLLRQRLSNKEISATLGISENTVKFHLGKIFCKSGVHDRDILADRWSGQSSAD